MLHYYWYKRVSLFPKELFIKFYSTSYCICEHSVNSHHPAARTEERKEGSRLLSSTVPQNTPRTAALLPATSRTAKLYFLPPPTLLFSFKYSFLQLQIWRAVAQRGRVDAAKLLQLRKGLKPPPATLWLAGTLDFTGHRGVLTSHFLLILNIV